MDNNKLNEAASWFDRLEETEAEVTKENLNEATMEMDWELSNGNISPDSAKIIKKFKLKAKTVDGDGIKLTGKVADLKKFAKEVAGDADGFDIVEMEDEDEEEEIEEGKVKKEEEEESEDDDDDEDEEEEIEEGKKPLYPSNPSQPDVSEYIEDAESAWEELETSLSDVMGDVDESSKYYKIMDKQYDIMSKAISIFLKTAEKL